MGKEALPKSNLNFKIAFDLVEAKKQLYEMYTTVSISGVKSMTWIFNRTMRKSIQGLHVDEHSLARVRSLAEQGKRVILMPIFKSFADAFILGYIHNYFEMELPFMFGHLEDTPHIKLMEKWVRSVGYIFMRRDHH